VEEAAILSGSCEDLTLELRKLRGDLAAVKHPLPRYKEAVNQAIREAPPSMWQEVNSNTLIHTVEDQYEYDLSGVDYLTRPFQVRNVYIEDDDGEPSEIGRWRIDSAGSALTLVLDSEPVELRHVRIKYLSPWPALDCTDRDDTTALDREWIVFKAMTILLMEADPQREDPNWLAQQLTFRDAQRQAREGLVRKRSEPSQYRTTNWRAHL
jgi:hypothetical protein